MTVNNTKAVFIIPLSRGYVARLSEIDRDLTEKIDRKDSTRVVPIKFSAVRSGDNHYAVRSNPGDNKVKIYLAREIMERKLDRKLVKGETVIFIDHTVIDGILDYTRDNLDIRKPNNMRSRKIL